MLVVRSYKQGTTRKQAPHKQACVLRVHFLFVVSAHRPLSRYNSWSAPQEESRSAVLGRRQGLNLGLGFGGRGGVGGVGGVGGEAASERLGRSGI